MSISQHMGTTATTNDMGPQSARRVIVVVYQTELYYMLCYIEIKAFIIIRQFGICVFLMDFW